MERIIVGDVSKRILRLSGKMYTIFFYKWFSKSVLKFIVEWRERIYRFCVVSFEIYLKDKILGKMTLYSVVCIFGRI